MRNSTHTHRCWPRGGLSSPRRGRRGSRPSASGDARTRGTSAARCALCRARAPRRTRRAQKSMTSRVGGVRETARSRDWRRPSREIVAVRRNKSTVRSRVRSGQRLRPTVRLAHTLAPEHARGEDPRVGVETLSGRWRGGGRGPRRGRRRRRRLDGERPRAGGSARDAHLDAPSRPRRLPGRLRAEQRRAPRLAAGRMRDRVVGRGPRGAPRRGARRPRGGDARCALRVLLGCPKKRSAKRSVRPPSRARSLFGGAHVARPHRRRRRRSVLRVRWRVHAQRDGSSVPVRPPAVCRVRGVFR